MNFCVTFIHTQFWLVPTPAFLPSFLVLSHPSTPYTFSHMCSIAPLLPPSKPSFLFPGPCQVPCLYPHLLTTKVKILRDKFNQKETTQRSGKKSHIYGFEELIFLCGVFLWVQMCVCVHIVVAVHLEPGNKFRCHSSVYPRMF